MASVLAALSFVVRFRPRVIVGVDQGALISALMTFPLLNEAAVRTRTTTGPEQTNIRRAWAGVAAIVSVNPVMLPQRSKFEEIAAAVPEILGSQPRGIYSVMVQSGTSANKQAFGAALAKAGKFPVDACIVGC